MALSLNRGSRMAGFYQSNPQKATKTSLKSFDESGNLTTTLIESGTGADKVQTWSFAGGDNLVIRATEDSTELLMVAL